MKQILFLSVGLFALAACEGTQDQVPAATTQSANQASAISQIVGKTLLHDNGSLTINSDGTISGTHKRGAVNMTWTEENGLYCREGTVGSVTVPRKCQTVTVSGQTVTFINPDGSVSATYTIG